MDEKLLTECITERFEDIIINKQCDLFIYFSLQGKDFVIEHLDKDDHTGYLPRIFVHKNYFTDYPHIMHSNNQSKVPDELSDYHYICLQEENSNVDFFMTYEDKYFFVLDSLYHFLSLSEVAIETEFKKEFLFYWNRISKSKTIYNLFIGETREFQLLNTYYSIKYDECRLVKQGLKLNDLTGEQQNKIWKYDAELPAYFIPITDNRGILPPTENKPWGKPEILNILYGRDFCKIAHSTFEKIKTEKRKCSQVIIVFEMIFNGNSLNFTALLKFNNKDKDTLFNKISNQLRSVEIMKSQRIDYYFLNKQIGNDTSTINKNILIVGAGSLGSYVSRELVKSGFNNLTIFDHDLFEEANRFRFANTYVWNGLSKVNLLKYELELIHPEINIDAYPADLNKSNLDALNAIENSDLIIFTVGNSDIQLQMNTIFKDLKCDKHVFFVWLEAGGEFSHILKVNYLKNGCFECLFTNSKGDVIKNKVNKSNDQDIKDKTINNGCGATRVAYGTSVLLRTTSVLLDTINEVLKKGTTNSFLIDISPSSVINKNDTFIEGECNCCGNKH